MGKAADKVVEEERRTFVSLPLAQLVPGITRTAFRRKSPAGAAVMADWASIVGQRLAAESEPRKLVRGQLTIACSGPMAMELQHVADMLIQRINTHAGSAVVERLRFVQEPVRRAAPSLPKRRMVAAQPIADMPGGELHDALADLLAAIRGDGPT